jgi:hypothetical protein
MLFDRLVAIGWHTAAVSMRLLVGGGPQSLAASWTPAERSGDNTWLL